MRTKMTTEIVCPYCGARQERGIRNIEVYSITYTETECEKCGKEFLFKANIFYSSKKREAGIKSDTEEQ